MVLKRRPSRYLGTFLPAPFSASSRRAPTTCREQPAPRSKKRGTTRRRFRTGRGQRGSRSLAGSPAPPEMESTGGRPLPGKVEQVLNELESFSLIRRLMMLNVAREDGALLKMLVEMTGATRALEIGTSNGYSSCRVFTRKRGSLASAESGVRRQCASYAQMVPATSRPPTRCWAHSKSSRRRNNRFRPRAGPGYRRTPGCRSAACRFLHGRRNVPRHSRPASHLSIRRP